MIFTNRREPMNPTASTVRRMLCLEEMESREVPAAFVVTNTTDNPSFADTGSLRWAILNANGTPGPDTIQFNIPGSGVRTIFPEAALPTITDPVVIDGGTQPGFTTTPVIQLNGSKMTGNGLVISAGQSVVRRLAVNQFSGDGILMVANGGNTLQANFVGTDPTGTQLLGNGAGVHSVGSSGNLIQSNTIGGNLRAGVHLSTASNNVLQFNSIGLNAAGGALPNGTGVELDQRATANNVTQNTISGNRGNGISIHDAGTNGNAFSVNFVGTNPTVTAAVGNGNAGVEIYGGASGNQFLSNTFSGNGVAGVWLHDAGTSANFFQSCFIGTDNTGANPIANGAGVVITSGASGNNISFGVISGNTGSGVTIANSGTTGNLLYVNLIGTDATGTRPIGNGLRGVDLGLGASLNAIVRNIVSGNGRSGILIYGASDNSLENNLCGLNLAGEAAIPNGLSGLEIQQGASRNVIQSCVFSGNLRNGIHIHDAGTNDNMLNSNPCGTNVQGNAAVPNQANGVEISGGSQGTTFEAVTMSGNKLAGLYMHGVGTSKANVRNCFIGVDGTSNPGYIIIPNGIGVVVADGADGNSFGFNQVSGNIGGGMLIQGASGNLLEGNFYGIDFLGTGALPNGNYGLAIIAGSKNNLVGGYNEVNNQIGGNNGLGLWIDGVATTGNVIAVNNIGVDNFQNFRLGNTGTGVLVSGGANNNTIRQNLVGGSGGNGIELRDSGTTGNTINTNYVGTDPGQTKNFGNQFWGIIQHAGAANNPLQNNILGFNGSGGIFGG